MKLLGSKRYRTKECPCDDCVQAQARIERMYAQAEAAAERMKRDERITARDLQWTCS